MKSFDIPEVYRSEIIGLVKKARRITDPRKKDFTPTELDFGNVSFLIARHFGFCYGVENAIEKSYQALEENPNKRIFLLSQMIHNQEVNNDLQQKGMRFIMDTDGTQLISWENLNSDDIVIIPAFGTTLEIEKILLDKGIEIQKYNTTCPFVEKVWKRSSQLGDDKFTVIIHGKHRHEETRATFSHSSDKAPSLILKDMKDAEALADFILGKRSITEFYSFFDGKYSNGFNAEKDLERIGVVNQTTMLATETQGIAEFLKSIMIKKYGELNFKEHFADTRDTLCYATNDNQQATYGLLSVPSDLAVVVGGYNSSNTSHLVELCEEKVPAYFINSAAEIVSDDEIYHFNIHTNNRIKTVGWLPAKEKIKIILTSGASCPDTLIDEVLKKILSYFPGHRDINEVLGGITSAH